MLATIFTKYDILKRRCKKTKNLWKMISATDVCSVCDWCVCLFPLSVKTSPEWTKQMECQNSVQQCYVGAINSVPSSYLCLQW